METVLDNMFIVSIAFGTNEVTRLVFAVNKEDAIHTIKQYYSEPNIIFTMSYTEIKNLYDKAIKENEEQFYFIIERVIENNKTVFLEHYERSNEIEKLFDKYKNKDCFFCNKEMIIDLVEETENFLGSPKSHPIFSDLILIDSE